MSQQPSPKPEKPVKLSYAERPKRVPNAPTPERYTETVNLSAVPEQDRRSVMQRHDL
jgi:hypothetical protein